MALKEKFVKTAVAVFGAAISTIHVGTELHADIIDLTFSPESIPPNGSFAQNVVINELALNFSQWNDSVGKTMYAGSLSAIDLVQYSQMLSTNTFAGGFTINFTANQTGTAYVGFRSAGNVGWFSLNLGGLLGDIAYLDGEYGSMGESLHVGGQTIPEPSGLAGLAILAIGAVGVRRNRRQ